MDEEWDGWYQLGTTLSWPNHSSSGTSTRIWNSTTTTGTYNYTWNVDNTWRTNVTINNIHQYEAGVPLGDGMAAHRRTTDRFVVREPAPVYNMEQVVNMQGQVVRTEAERAHYDAVMGEHYARRAERQREREELVARRRARDEVARIAATARADELLMSLLSPEQVASYVDDQYIDVIGSEGGRFRLYTTMGSSGNVAWLRRNGSVGGRICAHPTMAHGYLPMPDILAGQVIALITDERAFCAVANVHQGPPPPVLQRAA